mmetsp:Transcript_2794/g.5146  ORF Transcript_2794/g.5146 Transcript_2794/m.5146 type:complete len:334 (+) Transcript_2794:145-1146(+)
MNGINRVLRNGVNLKEVNRVLRNGRRIVSFRITALSLFGLLSMLYSSKWLFSGSPQKKESKQKLVNPILDFTPYQNMLDYKDCAGRTFEQMHHTYHRNGILLFTPCSLVNDTSMDAIGEKLDERCGPHYHDNRCQNRIQDWGMKDVNRIAINAEILAVMDALHGRKSFPFQTLNFKWGTGQPLHSDLMHFAGFPSMTMAGAWVALEDIHPDAGPLHYVLRSHLDKFYHYNELGCDDGAHSSCYESALQSLVGVKVEEGVWEMAVGLPKKGEVIIWGSNAIHGGSGFKHTHRHVNMNTCTHTHAHEMCVHMCTFTHTCVCAHVSRVCVHRHQRS